MATASRDVLTAHVALLRAVNLAGHNRVVMADLRRLLTELGLRNVQSLLQSGNLVFRDAGRTGVQLETLLQDAAARRLGLKTDIFVRSAAEWTAIVRRNPFGKAARQDPGHLLVVFLKDAPDRRQVAALERSISGREVFHARGRHLYMVYPDGIGRSRLTMAKIEGTLGTSGTGRNWNTVLKLGELATARPGAGVKRPLPDPTPRE